MNRYILIGVAVAVLIGVVMIFSSVRSDTAPEVTKTDLDRLAYAQLVDYDGNEVSLEQFRGKSLVINSWAIWCPFCKKELPDFAALQKEFGAAITVIAIDRGESLEKVRGYTNELGITADMVFLLDSSDTFYKTIGGFSMPETIFLDESGAIAFHKRGPMTLDEMREAVNRYLTLSMKTP